MAIINAPDKPEKPTPPSVPQAAPAMPAPAAYNVLDEKPMEPQRDLKPREVRLAENKPFEPTGLPSELVSQYQAKFGKSLDDDYAASQKRKAAKKIQDDIAQYGIQTGRATPEEVAVVKQKRAEEDANLATEALRGLYEIYKQFEPVTDAVTSGAGAVAKDVATGVTTDFKHITLGGPIAAVNSAVDLLDNYVKWWAKHGAEIRDVDPAKIPQVKGTPQSMTGTIGKSITQFLTGFALVPMKGGSFGKDLAKAALTDFTFFDAQEGNLANLIKSLGGDGNLIVEFLATDKNTGEIEGRLKNALAGSVTDVMFAGLMKILRVMKKGNKAKQLAGARTYKELQAKTVSHATPEAPKNFGDKVDELLGGGPNAELNRIEAKVRPVDLEVPIQVAAKSLDDGSYRFPDVKDGNIRYYAVIGAKEAQAGKVLTYSQDLDAVRAKVGPDDRLVYADVSPENYKFFKEQDAAAGRHNEWIDGKKHTMTARLAEKPTGTRMGSKPPPLPELESTQNIINWGRINSQDDVLRTLSDMADGHRAAIKDAQRGKRSNIRTVAAAGDENAWQLLVGKRSEDAPLAYNAEQTYALRQLWTSSGEKLTELAKAAQTGDMETMFAFRRMLAIHNTIQQTVMGVRTETARALQQWAIPVGSSADKLKQIQIAIEGGGSGFSTRRLAAAISVLSETDGAEAVEKFVETSMRSKVAGTLREIFMNSILSGPHTHMVNMMSNQLVIFNAIAERQIAGLVGEVIDPVAGIKAKEAAIMLDAMRSAYGDMFRWYWWNIKASARNLVGLDTKAIDDPRIKIGRDKLEAPYGRAISTESYGLDPSTAWGKGVDYVGSGVTLPGWLLGEEDTFFKTINYRMELHSTAYRRASAEVEQGLLKASDLKKRVAELVSDPPEDLIQGAEKFAALNTFTSDPNMVANASRQLRDALDYYSVRNVGMPSGSYLIPFTNTPANILAYAFDRTPMAFIGKKFQADWAAGGARRNSAIARVGLGSGIIGTFYSLALDGNITGSGPTDWKETRTLRRGGWQKYSIRVQTGTNEDGSPKYRWFAYNRLDPIGLYIGMAADLAEFTRNNDSTQWDSDIEEIVAAMVQGIAQNVTDKTYFTSVARLMAAVQAGGPRRMERVLDNLGATIVPNALAQIARANDPVARHTWDLMSTLQSKLPYFRKGLPPRLDFWGRPIEYKSNIGSAYDIIMPIYSSDNTKSTPVDREFMRIGYHPTVPYNIHVQGARKPVSLSNRPAAKNKWITLTAKTSAIDLLSKNQDDLAGPNGNRNRPLIARMIRYGNRNMYQVLEDTIKTNREYKEADNEGKKDILSKVMKDFRKVAKIQTIREHPVISEAAAKVPERTGEEAPF